LRNWLTVGVLLAALLSLGAYPYEDDDSVIPDPVDFQLPLSNPGRTGINDLWCSDGMPAIPALTCGVGVVTGTDNWECYDRSGNSIPVTQGTDTTYESSPYGRVALIDTVAKAPRIQAAVAAAAGLDLLITNPNTIMVTAASGLLGNRKLFTYGDLSVGNVAARAGLVIDDQGGMGANAQLINDTAPRTDVAVSSAMRFVVASVRNTGEVLQIRANGVTDTTPVTLPVAIRPPTAWDMVFGNYSKSAPLPLGGPARSVDIFACAVTDASLAAYEASVWGARASSGLPVSTTRAGPAWVRDAEGKPHQIGDNAPAVEPVVAGPVAAIQRLSHTRDLTQAVWVKGNATIERLTDPDGTVFNRITATAANGNVAQTVVTLPASIRTMHVRARRAVGVGGVSLGYGTGSVPIVLNADWMDYGATRTPEATGFVWILQITTPGDSVDVLSGGAYDGPVIPTERLDCGASPCTRGTPGQGDVQARNLLPWSSNLLKWDLVANPILSSITLPDGSKGIEIKDDTNAGEEGVSKIIAPVPASGSRVTFSCEMWPGTTNEARLWMNFGNGNASLPVTLTPGKSSIVSVSATVPAAPSFFTVAVYSAGTGMGSIRVRRCQLEPGDVFSGTWIETAANPAERRSGGGLEAYGAVLNYWINSPDICNAPSWPDAASSTCTTDAGGWQVVTSAGGGRRRSATGSGAGAYTLSCDLASGTTASARLQLYSTEDGYLSCDVPLTTGFQRLACTKTLTGTTSLNAYLSTIGAGGSIKVRQCQLEKSATPGRRCDAGASPTTCPADVHTVSTAGWPVSSGWCEVTVTPKACGKERTLVSTRSAFSGDGGAGWEIYWGADDRIGLRTQNKAGAASFAWGNTRACTVGQTVRARFEWVDGRGLVYRYGVLDSSTGIPMPNSISATARIGSRFDGALFADAYISDIACGGY
jgi:hypothetical protein